MRIALVVIALVVGRGLALASLRLHGSSGALELDPSNGDILTNPSNGNLLVR